MFRLLSWLIYACFSPNLMYLSAIHIAVFFYPISYIFRDHMARNLVLKQYSVPSLCVNSPVGYF